MNVNEFLIKHSIKNSSELAKLCGCERATISKRADKGWQIDYHIVDGRKRLGWLKPDGVLFFEADK